MKTDSSRQAASPTVRPLPRFLRKWTLSNPQVAACGNHDHFALIYDHPDEQLDFIVPFLRLGLERGEKSVYIYDDNSAETVIEAMEGHGIDVGAAAASGALSILTKNHAYLKNGDFDPEWMIDFLGQAVEDGKREGYPAVRASGEMTWALGPAGDAHDSLIEYECKLNTFFSDRDMAGICQYNRRRFRAQTLMHVIHTHPRIVFRGEVCENPCYIPAEIFEAQDEGTGEAIRRLLESMAENTRLRRELEAESEALDRSERLAAAMRKAAKLAHKVNDPLVAVMNLHYLLKREDLRLSSASFLEGTGNELERVCRFTERMHEALRAGDSNGEAGTTRLK